MKAYILIGLTMLTEEIKGVTTEAAFLALSDMGCGFLLAGSGRYSYVSAGPVRLIKTINGKTSIGGDNINGSPFEALSEALKPGPKGPFPFNSGAVGYFSYDLKDILEPGVKFRKKPGLDIPDCVAGIYDPVFVYDRHEARGWLVSASSDRGRFGLFKDALRMAKPAPEPQIAKAGGLRSDTSRDEYIAAVRKVKEYISSGDIYQMNLSQRLSLDWTGDPFSLYRRLAISFPAPYASFIDFGEFQLISNSPECLLRVEDCIAETRPIKGTRKRGKTDDEDQGLISELRRSKKERAEHVMIVDLERNDLGKVCAPGTVEVSSFESIETYPNLHHMVSVVRGRLPEGISPALALEAIFPGGSITGAPKVRAMEIIDELEKTSRSVYTGGMGWFDFSGVCDISMAIRTAVIKNGLLELGVGGGIVADSVPEEEYEETILKAQDFLKALGADEA